MLLKNLCCHCFSSLLPEVSRNSHVSLPLGLWAFSAASGEFLPSLPRLSSAPLNCLEKVLQPVGHPPSHQTRWLLVPLVQKSFFKAPHTHKVKD